MMHPSVHIACFVTVSTLIFALMPENAHASARKPRLVTIPVGQSAVVGTLRPNGPLAVGSPQDFCLEDGKLWIGSTWRLADRHVFGLKHATLAPLMLKTVVLFGSERRSLDEKIVAKGPCPESHKHPPPMQLRSDWLAPETTRLGRSTHARLKTRPYWLATGARSVNMVQIKVARDGVAEARIVNPFARPLKGLTVTWHYEGGPGKPMPRFERQKITLAPGAFILLKRPISTTRMHAKRGPAIWRLHKVGVATKLPRLTVHVAEIVPRGHARRKP